MKKVINIKAQSIQFTFDGLEPITLDVTKVSADVQDYAVYHGLQARIGDNAAISRKQPDGSVIVVTEEMRRNAVKELVDHYESGSAEWNIGRKAAAQNPAILALAEKLGKSYAEAQAYIVAKAVAELEA